MDNFFIRMFRREAPSPVADSAPSPSQVTAAASFESNVVRAGNPQVALTVSAVYRATELRAKTIGLMPVQLQRKDSVRGNFCVWDDGEGRRLNYLLQEEPNPLMTAPSLWEQVTVDRLQRGNAFVYLERDAFGDVQRLWLSLCGGYNMATGEYSLTYLGERGVVSLAQVPSRDVLHFPNTFRDLNGFWGIPTLRYAFDTLSLIKTQGRQALETAAKGGRMKLLVQEKDALTMGTRGRANQSELRKITRQLSREMYEGDAVFLNNVAEVRPISMTAADMQSIELLSMGSDDVARFWGTPRPLLMLDSNSHYNDYQNATMEYLQRTIAPDVREMEAELARKLLGSRHYGRRRIHVCEKPLTAMDPERQAKVDQLNLQTGAQTVNEIRAGHDMPAVEGGDTVYVSTNLAELGSPKLRASAVPAPQEGGGADGA